MTAIPKETKSVDVQLTRLFTNDYKLNAKIYDSTLWSQPFCTPSWDSSSVIMGQLKALARIACT